MQANVDPREPFETWDLEKLAAKMKQFVPQLQDLSGDKLQQVLPPPLPCAARGARPPPSPYLFPQSCMDL